MSAGETVSVPSSSAAGSTAPAPGAGAPAEVSGKDPAPADTVAGKSETQPGTSSATAAEPAVNPLDGLGSMFSGWMSAASEVANAAAESVAEAAKSGEGVDAVATEENRSAGDASGVADGVAVDAGKWLSDAGKMWETAVKDVGERLEAAKLDEKVNEFRETSTHFVADMTKNVQGNLDGLDGDAIRQRAELLEASTKQFLATASEQLQTRTKEAIDIFVDNDESKKTASGGHCAPWDAAALPENERKHADALRKEMLKQVVDSIYSKKRRTTLFLSGAAARASFSFDAEANAGRALAVLEADQNMRRLRSGLVPQKIPEDVFWNEYFYNVQCARNTLVANNGVMPTVETGDGDDDDAALFGDDDDDEAEEIPSLHSPVRPPAKKVEDTGSGGASGAGGSSTGGEAAGKAPDGESSGSANKLSGNPASTPTNDGRDWENEIDALFGDDKDE